MAPRIRFHPLPLVLCLALGACSDETGTTSSNGDAGAGSANGDAGGARPPASADAITESVLAACPQASTLIQTSEWPSCLAGRRVAGKEPFNDTPCELRIGANGRFDYARSGTVVLTVPERSGWRGATGNYQNELSAGRRFFLAGLAPDLPDVEGQPRVTDVDLAFNSVGQDETVAVRYLDATRARQTYTCKVDVL